jgi:hypothetical protein
MANQFLTACVSLGLLTVFAGAARSAVVEVEEGRTAEFRWAPASGPVDHYQIEIATEAAPPFSWSTYGVTDALDPSVSLSNSVLGADSPGVVHWAFDENAGTTAADWSGSGYSGTVSGAQWVAGMPGGGGAALRFDGLDDSVQLGAVDIGGQALTISLWFKADDFGTPSARLISKATSTSESAHYWMLSTVDSSPKLRFRLKTNGATTTLIASSGTLSAGVWTHVVGVYDGSTMRLYKDGVMVGSTPKTGTVDTNSSVTAAIGNQPTGGGSRPFDGVIDDVRIYDEALTDPQIAALAAGAVTSAEWVTVRAIACDAVGNVGDPSPISQTVHFVPAIVWAYSLPDDFDGDSISDLLTHLPAAGVVELHESASGLQVDIPTGMGPDWEIAAQGDFDGDTREDLFWRNWLTGDNRLWLEVGDNPIEEDFAGFPELANNDPAWEVLASGDFDDDGFFDLFWRNADTGRTQVWFMDGATARPVGFPRVRSASWVLDASADFDGSGTYDLFWRNLTSNETAVWQMDGDTVAFADSHLAVTGQEVVDVVDQNGDGFMDLIWQDMAGNCEVWLMTGGDLISEPAPIGAPTCPAAP